MISPAPFSMRNHAIRRWMPLVIALLAWGTTAMWIMVIDGLTDTQRQVGAVFWSVLGLLALRNAVGSWYAQLSMDAKGLLTIRPGLRRSQHVDLRRLRRVEGLEEGRIAVPATGGARVRVTPVLQLEDAHNSTVRITPGEWDREDVILAAVAYAAAATGCPVIGGELFGLTDRPEASAAPRPLHPAGTPVHPIRVRLARSRRALRAGLAGIYAAVGALIAWIGAAAEEAASDMSGFVTATRIVALILGASALAVAVSGWRRSITLEPDGRLTQSGSALSRRRMELAMLASVRVAAGPWTRTGWRRAEKAATVTLTDQTGRTMELVDRFWEDPQPLMLAVAAWTARTGATVDERSLRYLVAAQRPTAFGLGRSFL